MSMNIFQRIFATAFVFSALLLGWVYFLGFMKPEEPANPKWEETLNSLHNLYRITYRQSHNTLQQASAAHDDSLYATAVTMRAIAESERINCRICQQAIESLGDKISTPSMPTTSSSEIQDTEKIINLKLDQKRALNHSDFPKIIEQALSDENRYIARMLTWYNSNNNQHLILLELCQVPQKSASQSATNAPSQDSNQSQSSVSHRSCITPHQTSRANAYNVCPTCGYIFLMEFTPYCCPHCMTPKRDFLLFK